MENIIDSQIAFVTLQNKSDLLTSVCRIELQLYEKDCFCFVFYPFYDVIEELEKTNKRSILLQGINLQLRKKQYRRYNYIPAFISERIPHNMRNSSQLPFVFQWLFKSEKHYFGDRFIVTPNAVTHKINC